MPFQIIRQDITKVHADVIVNTANPNVAIGAGVDAAVYKAAGAARLLEERAKIGCLSPGKVAMTQAFALPAKALIHSCGPVWRGGSHQEERILRECYEASLQLALDNGYHSIAFPLMATGSNRFPKELGLQIASSVFVEFLKNHDMEIFLVIYPEYKEDISGRWKAELRRVLEQESSIRENTQYTIREDRRRENRRDRRFVSSCCCECTPTKDFEDESLLIDECKDMMPEDIFDGTPVEEESLDTVSNLCQEISPTMGSDSIGFPHKTSMSVEPPSIADIIRNMPDEGFVQHLQMLINKKGLKNSEVYSAANISKQYFSKLLKGQVTPSREKVLALALGLHLNLDEATDFISQAGYTWRPDSKMEAVVRHFITMKEYNVIKIDIVLFDYGLPLLTQ